MRLDPKPPQWITIAEAAELMNLGKRGAHKRLVSLNDELDGRLLRVVGKRHMGTRVQPGKYLVSLDVLRQSTLEPDREQLARELEDQRISLIKAGQKIETLRRTVSRMLRFLETLGFTPSGTATPKKPGKG